MTDDERTLHLEIGRAVEATVAPNRLDEGLEPDDCENALAGIMVPLLRRIGIALAEAPFVSMYARLDTVWLLARSLELSEPARWQLALHAGVTDTQNIEERAWASLAHHHLLQRDDAARVEKERNG